MKKILGIVAFSLLTPVFCASCNNNAKTFNINFSGVGVNFDKDTDKIKSNQNYTIGAAPVKGYSLSINDFTITVGNSQVTASADTWNWSDNVLTIKSKIITNDIDVAASANAITYTALVTKEAGIEIIGSYDDIVSIKKDFTVNISHSDGSKVLKADVKINGIPSNNYTLENTGGLAYKLTIKSEYIVGAIEVNLKLVQNDISVSTTAIDLLTYGSDAITYQIPTTMIASNITADSSDPTLFTIAQDQTNKTIKIDSNLGNKSGTANIIFKNNETPLAATVSVSIKHPSNIDEARDSFTFAAIKKEVKDPFDVTFNFNNTVSAYNFELAQEIYGRMDATTYVSYSTGVNKTNTFKITKKSFGGTPSGMYPGDEYYRYNPDNINYLNRKTNVFHTNLYIDTINRTLTVHNSEELFWAVEHGYKPNIPAVKTDLINLYNKARDICKETVDPSKTEFEKLRILFEKLESLTHYDYWVLDQSGYWFNYDSYFLEGVFNDTNIDEKPDGYAVCDGFSKAYALLCGIEGLPCIRSCGFTSDSGHAWNYIKLDGIWYLACPTWCKAGLRLSQDTVVSIMDYNAYGASRNYFADHGSAYAFTDLEFTNYSKSATSYCSSTVLSLDQSTQGHTFLISNDSDAAAINTVIKNNIAKMTVNHSYVCFAYKSTDYSKLNGWYNKIFSGLSGFDGYMICDDSQPTTTYATAWAYLIQ